MSHKQAKLWGGREGRVVRHWARQVSNLPAPRRSETPLAPSCRSEQIHGHKARIASVEDTFIMSAATPGGDNHMKIVAGIDVGKTRLEASVAAGSTHRFDNTPQGINSLRDWLASRDANLVVCEPTGGYERRLVDALLAADIPVHLAHPNNVRGFARACGHEAKTDRLDAQTLSRYGEVFEPPGLLAQDQQREELRDLLRRRQQLVRQRVQELNRLDKGLTDKVRASTKRHIAWLDAEIDSLDAEYRETLRNSAELSQQAALYRSVPGVGQQTAAILAACMPELGRCDGKALTALAGLAPWSQDSGSKRGYRAIRGGRGAVRRALYMAALSAIRHNRDLRRFYQQLRQRGKPGKVALVAVMRKLLLQLNAIAQRRSPWIDHYSATP